MTSAEQNASQDDRLDSSAYVDGRYWESNSTFHEEDSSFKAGNLVRLLERSGVMPSSILDIGCASGAFLRELVDLVDGPLVGIDLAEAAIERARELTPGDRPVFRQGSVAALDETFDLATLNDVFEHVEDYLGFLKSIRSVASMLYFHIPLDMTVKSAALHSYMGARRRLGHLHYFSEASAIATLEYCGYEIIDHQLNSAALLSVQNRRGVRSYISAGPRILAHRLSPRLAAQWFGGSTLSVLARPTPSTESE